MPFARLDSLPERESTAPELIWQALQPEQGHAVPLISGVMITSIDGTATVAGRSSGLGTPTDFLVYSAMRARSDLIIVGAATALAEGYGPAEIDEAFAPFRTDPAPAIVLLSTTLTAQIIDHCRQRGPHGLEIAVPRNTNPDLLEQARTQGVTVHCLEPGPIGPAVRALCHSLGAKLVSCEGGPRLLGALFADNAIDELVHSISPSVIIGGDATRLVSPEIAKTAQRSLQVETAFTAGDGGLYCRWARKFPASAKDQK